MKNENFWNRLAKNYDDTVGEQTVAITKRYLKRDDTVLDYGCARGAYTMALADGVKEIHGIDISPKMIEFANEKSKNIIFKQATIFDIHDKYDVVLAFNLLHLIKDIENVMLKIDEILKPDGRFISVTTCMKENFMLRCAGFVASKIGGVDLCNYSIAELKNTISQRFDIVETELFTSHHVLFVAQKSAMN